MASGAVAMTSAISPLRAFPLLLAFPTVILAAWFLGMWGAAGCAFMDVALVNTFLTRSQFQFSTGNVPQQIRLAVFVLITLLLGWSVRRLAQQKAELENHELKRRLESAESERRLAEERATAGEQLRYRDDVLQLALKASGMGLWAWDFEKEVVHRSDEVYRMVGSEPGAFGSEPRAWLQFVVPEDVPLLDEAFAKARKEGADYHAQYRVRWPDGSLHWLESQGKCQLDPQGKATRMYGVMADITHRKQSEEAMLRAEKLAVAGRLAASVAHEINNPLEAVANMLYLITISDSTEQAHTQAASALEELMRISLVAQSTLKFHRESGAPRIALLSEILDSVLNMFHGKIQTTPIAVRLRTDQELPVTCMLSEIQQVFANLISNAIEAMPSGGKLTLRVRPSRDWRNRAYSGMRVTICDTGTGMDRATVARIFEPFFTTKEDTGTGLGLWVVAQLLERHQGSVNVRSSQKPGASSTVFSVFLPFGKEPDIAATLDNGESTTSAKTRRDSVEAFTPGSFLQHLCA
jgi:PAS domain S-box-containing protein